MYSFVQFCIDLSYNIYIINIFIINNLFKVKVILYKILMNNKMNLADKYKLNQVTLLYQSN